MTEYEQKTRRAEGAGMHLPAIFSLLFLPVSLLLLAYYQVEQTALLSFLAVIIALLPFFVSFERRKWQVRNLLPIVVMTALATAGRLLFAAAPNFKPVLSIIIVTAISFGPASGFMTGALTALASNLFFGQGPWTPWQMYAFGLVAYLAGVLQQKAFFKRPLFVYIYGFLSAFLYGIILDTWHVISFLRPVTWQGALLIYGQGAIFNLLLAIATVVFLIPIRAPWTRQLDRIKQKFGLMGG
ncbi:MAG TPA: ECF transporter S component [Oscillospiraceae bacterium]|nr:ECF transporter S component [Oscillospiraceae bacterium]